MDLLQQEALDERCRRAVAEVRRRSQNTAAQFRQSLLRQVRQTQHAAQHLHLNRRGRDVGLVLSLPISKHMYNMSGLVKLLLDGQKGISLVLSVAVKHNELN